MGSVEISVNGRAMKVEDVPRCNVKGRTGAWTLECLESHTDEVFRIRQCSQIAEALGAPKRTVEHALWSLQRDGLISKARWPGSSGTARVRPWMRCYRFVLTPYVSSAEARCRRGKSPSLGGDGHEL